MTTAASVISALLRQAGYSSAIPAGVGGRAGFLVTADGGVVSVTYWTRARLSPDCYRMVLAQYARTIGGADWAVTSAGRDLVCAPPA